ncbi:hypothetical protein [Bartonella sp. ML70XJBT.G]|uniref:hypothetical protein n=1 Tax=Bartonella sp. ML70XJBT.G TaxID=3019093 RepID=UPI00235F14D5|nr:hypothetical protein [Bartonella sp. ML70XJBT.G]
MIVCFEKVTSQRFSKIGGDMMQEWVKIYLTGLVSFPVLLLVALILRYKDRKEAAKIHKEDSETAAKKREEDRE